MIHSKNINYSCHSIAFREGEQFVVNHSLIMVLSGEMELKDREETRIFRKGDICFARKNHLLKFVKRPAEGEEEFRSLSIIFDDELLKEMAEDEPDFSIEKKPAFSFINLSDPHLSFFMTSILQYQEVLEDKNTELGHLKLKEAIMLILNGYPELKHVLFDFSEPHKINLEEFMQKNFHFNVKIERFAYLTGRSLATFKRDFQKIFQMSPRSWLQQRRLQEAYFLIKEKKCRPGEIYLDLGFEDFSHFSFAFKKQFGYTPSDVLKV